MSETWEDIVGSLDKLDRKPAKAREAPAQRFSHESEERTTERRLRALDAIYNLFPNAVMNASGVVTAEIQGKKFDFWPASDCWFSYSKQLYGSDIPTLCAKVANYFQLKPDAPEGDPHDQT